MEDRACSIDLPSSILDSHIPRGEFQFDATITLK
jgi:hypothetical protein